MVAIRRVVVSWAGLQGLPGYSVFYSSSSVDATASLGTFFTSIKGLFPTGLTWGIPSSGDTLEDTNGALTGSWSGGTAATVAANGGGTAYAAGCGGYVNWGTTLVVGKRRLRGRTFLAPMIGTAYDTNGTLASGSLTILQTAATALASSANPISIWHRPRAGAGGTHEIVSTAFVPDQVTSLRTRRK